MHHGHVSALPPCGQAAQPGFDLRAQSGNVAVVHAAADPALPMVEQSDDTLIWGHARFAQDVREDGIWIVHGHTIVHEPVAAQGRISIDTGAFATGDLTAAIVQPGSVTFQTA